MKLLDELERLRAAATQGEWLDFDAPGTRWDTPLCCGYDRRGNHSTPDYYATGPRVETAEHAELDSRLIVAAVNALPELVEVARAAEVAIDAAARLDPDHYQVRDVPLQNLFHALSRLAARGEK